MFNPSEILNYGWSNVIKKLNVLQGDFRIHLKTTLSIIFIYFLKTKSHTLLCFSASTHSGGRRPCRYWHSIENPINHNTLFHTGNSTRLQTSLLPQPDLPVVSFLVLYWMFDPSEISNYGLSTVIKNWMFCKETLEFTSRRPYQSYLFTFFKNSSHTLLCFSASTHSGCRRPCWYWHSRDSHQLYPFSNRKFHSSISFTFTSTWSWFCILLNFIMNVGSQRDFEWWIVYRKKTECFATCDSMMGGFFSPAD